MKKKNLQEMKQFGTRITKNKPFLILLLFATVTFLTLTSFRIYQNEIKTIGTLLNNLSTELGKRGGCENTKDALILMEAYQILYREKGELVDLNEKLLEISGLLLDYDCSISVGGVILNPPYAIPPNHINIDGGVSTEYKIPAYILALEMMTPKQKDFFQKSLPNGLNLEYSEWEKNNVQIKEELNKNLVSQEIKPIDIDNNFGELFKKAIEENKSIKLEDYQIDKKELDKLLNNQNLIHEINKQNTIHY